MRAKGRQRRSPAWTIMLADVVALMLAFFVLGLSMRVILPTEGAPLIETTDPEAAMAALERWSAESLTAAERASEPSPPFAYLATILGRLVADGSANAIRHDDRRLSARLDADPLPANLSADEAPSAQPSPAEPGPADDAAQRQARNLLLAMAFLARRFDLELAVTLATSGAPSLAGQVEQSRRLQAWLGAETRHRAPTVVFVPAMTDAAMAPGAASGWRVDLQRRPRPAPKAAAP